MPEPGAIGSPERAVARVDLGAVARNCAHLRSRLSGGAELCAVVKADAYGHGQIPCAQAALDGGATTLAVATAPEAAALRDAGIEARVLVMGALTGESLAVALGARAEVTAWNEAFVGAIAEQAGATPTRVHVKLDTGMGRLGTRDPDEARAVAAAVAADDRLEVAGLMTHFATADERGDEYFPQQLEAFKDFVGSVRVEHPDAIVHAANSAATLREPASHFDMVRCGIAVYGLDPYLVDARGEGLEPALSLESYVAEVKRIGAGESVGYGRSWRAERDTSIGVLPIGYADGVRRGLSNRGEVLVGGRRHPLVATISMDNVTIDLGPETDVVPGAPAVLIGVQREEEITCEQVAEQLGTINYEVTCGIGPRVRRAHTGR